MTAWRRGMRCGRDATCASQAAASARRGARSSSRGWATCPVRGQLAAVGLRARDGHSATGRAGESVAARAVLGFPEGRFLAYTLSVGYPSDKPLVVIERLNRRPFDEVVHRGGCDQFGAQTGPRISPVNTVTARHSAGWATVAVQGREASPNPPMTGKPAA